MNEFKDIFSEYITDLAIAVKLGEKFNKTSYMIARDFTVNFDLSPHLGSYLFDSLQNKSIYHFLLNY